MPPASYGSIFHQNNMAYRDILMFRDARRIIIATSGHKAAHAPRMAYNISSGNSIVNVRDGRQGNRRNTGLPC